MYEALGTHETYRAQLVLPQVSRVSASPVIVLHVFKYFRPDFTGDGLYLEKLIPLLERHGVENEVIAETTRPIPGAIGARLFGRGGSRLFNPLMFLWFLVNAWRFDVVHFHSAVDRHFLYHLIARIFGCRVVQSCTLDDGLGSLVRGYRPAYRRIARRLSLLIDDVVAISPQLHQDSLEVVPPSRVHLIPQGVAIPDPDPAARSEARRRFGFTGADTVLLFVGGLCARKDVKFLVENHPPELGRLHLLLVGPVLEPAYAEDLRAAIAAHPAARRIHIAGYMNDPSSAYRAADIFVFASQREGFGNVLLEAMAQGLPVICRRLPGITDSFIEHGRTGELFDTAPEYRDAVRRHAADPAARARLGDAARRAVALGYDLRTIAARYAILYGKGK